MLAAVSLIGGCGYMQLVGEQFKESVGSIDLQSPLTVSKPEATIDGVLAGSIRGAVSENSPIAVVAFATSYSPEENRRSDHLSTYILLPQPGPYALFVPAGQYKILAFVDTNRNFVLEPDEFAGRLEQPGATAIQPNQIVANLDIELKQPGIQRFDFPVSLENLPLQQVPKYVLEYGGTIVLDNDIFRRKYASMGLWQPEDFVEKIGVYLYALEPVDPARIPVLFVHGINGTPLDWKYLARGLDSNRFQPWFYYYPSGLRLNLVSGLLHQKIQAIEQRYGFEKLVVVAHSMGGLVSRDFINRRAGLAGDGCLYKFVSISTPWGGDKSARVGLSSSPVSVPSWEDVAEGSLFIEELYQKALPASLEFYLFFSYGGNRRFHWDANDGTVTLQSQLDPRAKNKARLVEGFHEDHITVLASSDVEQKLNELLAVGNPPPLPSAVRAPPARQAPAAGEDDNGTPAVSAKMDYGPLPNEVKRYVAMLESVESDNQIEAARRIYRKRLKHPAIFDTAARQLREGYRVNLVDSAHIDAMAWMCNLLGMSGETSYRSLLDKVVRETPNRKIRNYASKSMRRLNR